MGQLYAALVVAGIIAAGAVWLKQELKANASLKSTVTQQAGEITKKDNVIDFERRRLSESEARVAELEFDLAQTKKENTAWKNRYGALKAADPKVAEWGNTPVPPPVVEQLRGRDAARQADRIRAPQVAPPLQPGVPRSITPHIERNAQRGSDDGARRRVGRTS